MVSSTLDLRLLINNFSDIFANSLKAGKTRWLISNMMHWKSQRRGNSSFCGDFRH